MTAIMELLTQINIQSVTLLIGIAVLIQSGLIWLQSSMVREYHGIRTAAFGDFLFGVGMLLSTFRGIASDVITIITANYLIVFGLALMYVAIRRFLGERIDYGVLAVSIVPVVISFPYLTYVWNDFALRVHIIGVCSGILLSAIAVSLFRVRQSGFGSSAFFLASISALYVIILFLRSLSLLILPAQQSLYMNLITVVNLIAMFAASFLWSMGFVLMVSQRLQSTLADLATVDSLTRISNRRAMLSMLEAEFARVARSNIEFSTLLVDVDHFKPINDIYGHEMGDIVLCEVAQLLKNTLRKQDTISRWGGEEFLILLPDTTLRDAADIGERLRLHIEENRFYFDGHSVKLTISIGVGNSANCRGVNEIYKCSDTALYKAKVTRNSVAWNDMSVV